MIPCISSLLLSLALLPGCAPRPGPAEEIVLAPEIGPENYPRLDGSTSTEPILATIACHFLDLTCQWVEWLDGDRLLLPVLTENLGEFPGINSSGTHQAYLNLIQGQVDLILVARKPYYEENMAPVAERVKPLGVDGIVPGKNTIQTRDYPFTTEVYVVIRNDLPEGSLPYQLFKWLFTPEGQALVAESGYIPLD